MNNARLITKSSLSSIATALLLGSTFCPGLAAAAGETAKLYSVEGVVEKRPAGSEAWQAVPPETLFFGGDSIRTGENSRAAVVGIDGVMVRMGPKGLIKFKPPPAGAAAGGVEVGQGDAYVLSRDPHAAPDVTTAIVSGSVRGTEFAVSVKPDQVTFSVMNGQVALSNSAGSAVLNAGEEAVTQPGKAPVKRIMVRPYDAVQWALRYPAMISKETAGRLEPLAKRDKSAATLLEAGRALESGQVETAERLRGAADRGLAGRNDSDSAFLRALSASQRAVIAVTRNERELADQALADAESAQAGLVDSLYARSLLSQSRGDLAAARADIDAALAKEPRNPHLLARAAELAFGFGETPRAEQLIEQALADDPDDADALTVSGFILLARNKVDAARAAFERALASNSANAGAYLGLGIADFREGELDGGRVEIQKAVHLEPTTALYRSYLGKAFFESYKEELADEELRTASRLDPLDPTPHLYIAFNDLARYLPTSALRAIEDSIERNDNRAVYRSRLLLDQDKATRSAGLGRVFAALDFVDPARIEALKSLSEDPTNYSAHFLLKDSLIGPDTDNANITEDTVGTLLAPANFSALQPSAGGAASLNDYTTLFERAQRRTAVEAIGASQEKSVQTSEYYLAGGNDYSYLLNHAMTLSDGYRENDFVRLHSGRIVFQKELDADNKFLVESRIIGNENGDTAISGDPNENDPDLEFAFEDYTGRLGYHHSWGAQSHLIAQALYINSRSRVLDRSAERGFNLFFADPNGDVLPFEDFAVFDSFQRVRMRGSRYDAQHLWSSQYLTAITGASALSFNLDQEGLASAESDDLGVFQGLNLSSAGQPDVDAYRAYSYLTAKPVRWARLIGGAAYSDTNLATREEDPFIDDEYGIQNWSPKVGAQIYPTDRLTLRAAYYQAIGSASSRDFDGIEPSQLAGFLQTTDDEAGTESESYAIGLDWKLPARTYVGSEFLARNLKRASFSATQELTIDPEGAISDAIASERDSLYNDERTVRTYINQVISSGLVGTIEHAWIRGESESFDSETRTHRIRFGMNYYDPSGFFTFASATWRHQDRDFGPGFEEQESDFWIASGGLGWQFPDRHGNIQLAARNIFERNFTYEPVGSNVTIFPDVDITLGVSLNF